MGIEEIIGSKREEILRIAQKHGVTSIRVFGSIARGEAGPESDVDFLIEIGERLSPWFPVRLIRDLEELLGRHVDVVTPKGLHWYIKGRVLDEAVGL
jgi:predicted nucleotidyltransferase